MAQNKVHHPWLLRSYFPPPVSQFVFSNSSSFMKPPLLWSTYNQPIVFFTSVFIYAFHLAIYLLLYKPVPRSLLLFDWAKRFRFRSLENFDADCDNRCVFSAKYLPGSFCCNFPFHFTSRITKSIIGFWVHVVICFSLDIYVWAQNWFFRNLWWC